MAVTIKESVISINKKASPTMWQAFDGIKHLAQPPILDHDLTDTLLLVRVRIQTDEALTEETVCNLANEHIATHNFTARFPILLEVILFTGEANVIYLNRDCLIAKED